MGSERDSTTELAAFLEGSSSDDRHREDSYERFGEWLAEDEANVVAFVEHLKVEEDLRRLMLHDDVSRYVDTATKQAGAGRLAGALSQRRGAAVLAIACSLLLAAVLFNRPAGPTNEPTPRVAASPTVVATIGDARQCRWAANDYAIGQHIQAGSTMRLLKGVAQLTFETGAVLLLEGPCELGVAANAVRLDQGRVSAVVPPSASGFAVTTPNSQVIDIGTKFGVSVDDIDGTEVHVFSGEVVTRARNAQGETVGEPIFLTTHNAIHFRPGSVESQRFQADEQAFVRWLGDEAAEVSEATPPVEGELVLWLDNKRWIVDGEGRVTLWRDTLTPANRVPDNALQAVYEARPRVVHDAVSGRPAVAFDGVDDCLITTPFATGSDQTIAFVATVRPGLHRDPQVINYNGPPQLKTWDRHDPNILQIVARADRSGRSRLHPFAFLGFSEDQGIRVGEAGNPEGEGSGFEFPETGRPFVAVYVYDHSSDHAELWVNGRSAGRSTAPAAVGLTSRKVIGRHGGYPTHFHGEVAELLIYDEGLDAARVDALGAYLKRRYRVAPTP